MDCKVEELITHLIMICDDEPFMSAAKSVTYGKVLIETIIFLKVRGGGVTL